MKANKEWPVTYRGSFWGAEGQPGREISLNREFQWGNRRWHVPAIYDCEEGIVMDFAIPVPAEDIRRFMEKWYPILKDDPRPANAVRQQAEAENPLEQPNFHPLLTVNGKDIHAESGCGISWIPKDILPEEFEDRTEAEDLLDHYGLDKNSGWVLHRARFPREEAAEIEFLSLLLQARPETFYGPSFPTPAVGAQVALTHPVTGTVHTLTVQTVQRGEFDKEIPMEGIEEWPRQYLSLEYTLSPDLDNHQFALRDTAESDSPRVKPDLAGCVGIIGGSDGPTAIIFSHEKGVHPHSVISSLHFEAPEQVIWQPEFREKLTEDFTVTLL